MERLDETMNAIYTATSMLNFLGGGLSKEEVARLPFVEVLELILRNGGTISFNISKDKFNNPVIYKYEYKL